MRSAYVSKLMTDRDNLRNDIRELELKAEIRDLQAKKDALERADRIAAGGGPRGCG